MENALKRSYLAQEKLVELNQPETLAILSR